jgi:hypothetical protein
MGLVLRSVAIVIAGIVAAGCGATLRERGYLAADLRVFPESPRHAGQSQGTGPSAAFEPDFSLQTDDTIHTLTLRPFLRLDAQDSARTHFDLRQADYVVADDGFELGLGVGLFSWGRLEGNRLVDVVNQIDLVEDLDRGDKLGQPYLRAAYEAGPVHLQVLYLPYQRERTFPGASGRLRSAQVIDTSETMYEARLGAWHPSFAARIGLTIDDIDLAVTGFGGVSREPTFVLALSSSSVVPRYDFLQQAGADFQWTHEGFAVKCEAAMRWWSIDYRFSWAVGTGLEHTFFDLAGSGADLTLILEHTYDQRPIDTPFTLLDNDVFYGFRLAIGNQEGTEIRAGGITDVEHGATFGRAEVRHRFGDHWTAIVEGQVLVIPEQRVERALSRDSFVALRVAYYL